MRRWARAAGFEHVSLDLIYGTPGSPTPTGGLVAAALAAGPDHVSAYALIVEDGTRLAARVRRGEIAAPDDDMMADRYLAADGPPRGGLDWYEISNWAVGPAAQCRTTCCTGPAPTGGGSARAHSHVGGTRWWNVRHPAAYAARLAAGDSPARPGRCSPSADSSWSGSC